MSFTKEVRSELVHETAKAVKALKDIETHFKSLQEAIHAQKRLLDSSVFAHDTKVEILPIMSAVPPPMREGKTLLRVNFNVTFRAKVVQEFIDYLKVPADKMFKYSSSKIEDVCLAQALGFDEDGEYCIADCSAVQDRLEEAARKFFKTHELMRDGMELSEEYSGATGPPNDRKIKLGASCWAYVPNI
jgi:hypothetical protein